MNVDKRHNSITDNKKTINRWLILFILSVCSSMAATAQEDVEINLTNFPDENFRAWLKDPSNIEGRGADGTLTATELDAITSIEIQNQGITDIKGIEFFTKINMLRLGGVGLANPNRIETVDLSSNNLLQRIYCRDIGAKSITLPTTKTVLRQIYCQDNPGLTGTLDLSGFTALEQFSCTGTNFEELYFKGCTRLKMANDKQFDFNVNLKKVDISNCNQSAFNSFDWSGKKLETIIADGCTSLNTLKVPATLKYLDISRCSFFVYNCSYSNIETLIAKECPNLNTLTFNQETLKYLDISNCTGFTTFDCHGTTSAAKDKYKPLQTLIAKDCANLTSLICNYNSLTSLDVSGCTELENLECNYNLLTDLNLDDNTKLRTLQCGDNLLNTIDVNPATHTQLRVIVANRSGHSAHHNIMAYAVLENIQINGGPYLRLNRTTGQHEEQNVNTNHVSMLVDGIQDIENMPNLRRLLCRHEDLTVLNLYYNTEIQQLELRNNRLLTMDLSRLTNLSVSNVKNQESIEDLVVFDRSEVGILLPNVRTSTDSTVNNATDEDNISRFVGDNINTIVTSGAVKYTKKVTVGGVDKYYLIIAKDATQDLDLYGKKLTYNYDTRYPGSDAAMKTMDVTITCNTYVMYFNPNSLTTATPDFYSGTICLPYDAIVPDGVTAYLITGLMPDGLEKITLDAVGDGKTSTQMTLVKYADAGEVIPKGVPVYVTATQPGLYAFQKNYGRRYHGWQYDASIGNPDANDNTRLFWEDEENPSLKTQPDNTGDTSKNWLKANYVTNADKFLRDCVDTTVSTHSILTLGREKRGVPTPGNVGFWMLKGDNVPAHRCYIDLYTSTPPGEGLVSHPEFAKGFPLSFGNNLNANKQ